MSIKTILCIFGLLFVTSGMTVANISWFATAVTSASAPSTLGADPYDDPASLLGKPTTWILGAGDPEDPFSDPASYGCSMVFGPYNTDPEGNKLITTIKSGGQITVEFDTPIIDDPLNWYGQDFIVFGHAFFLGSGGYVYPDTNMETFLIPGGGHWKQATVSVSQDNVNWYTYASPKADNFAPTQSFAWDWVNHSWGPEMDFTKPLDPILTASSFNYKTVAQAIDMYKSSGGGTSFNLAELPESWRDPVTGLKWIKYVKITGSFVSIDAVSRVSHALNPVSIGQAKALPDGARVILNEALVSAGTGETGAWCYIQHPDRSSGIRLDGRMLERGDRVRIEGVMSTSGSERVIKATSAELLPNPFHPVPLRLGGRSFGGGDFFPGNSSHGQLGTTGNVGLNNIGLLAGIWGKVQARDEIEGWVKINDGSGKLIKCLLPAQTSVPAQNAYVTANGIVSLEESGSNLLPVLRLRTSADLTVF